MCERRDIWDGRQIKTNRDEIQRRFYNVLTTTTKSCSARMLKLISIMCWTKCYPFESIGIMFGISSQPGNRWTKIPDYSLLDVMVVVFTSENSDDTAGWETKSITKYRGDKRLQNRKPGGENAHCGYSPHVLYVVLGRSYDFQEGRMMASVQ